MNLKKNVISCLTVLFFIYGCATIAPPTIAINPQKTEEITVADQQECGKHAKDLSEYQDFSFSEKIAVIFVSTLLLGPFGLIQASDHIARDHVSAQRTYDKAYADCMIYRGYQISKTEN